MLIKTGLKNLPENVAAFLRSRQEKLLEIPLCNHGNLRKLLSVQAKQFCHGSGDILELCHRNTFVRIHQLRIRLLCGITCSSAFGTLVFGISSYNISFSAIFKNVFHISRDIILRIFASEHISSPRIAAGLPIQRKYNGIENSRLSGSGISGNQVQPLPSQPLKIYLCTSRIRTEGAHCQFYRFHFSSSFSSAAVLPSSNTLGRSFLFSAASFRFAYFIARIFYHVL